MNETYKTKALIKLSYTSLAFCYK